MADRYTLHERINVAERALVILARAFRDMPKPLTHVGHDEVAEAAVDLLADRELAGAVDYYENEKGNNGGHS